MAVNQTKDRGGDLVFTIVNYVILVFFLVAVAYPLIYVLSASFSSPSAVAANQIVLWPVHFSTIGYEKVFESDAIWTGFRNSLLYTAGSVFTGVVLTILAAYPLSRKDFGIRNGLMIFYTITLLFSGGIIPTYLIVKSTGMLNTPWAMIIPGALSIYQVIITRTFFQASIPDELLEAAQIDGISDFRFVWDVVIPLSMPIMAVNALLYAVGQWNSFLPALLYLRDANLFPLQLVLRGILVLGNTNQLSSGIDQMKQLERQQLASVLKYALIVVSTVPVLVVYPFVQKHFVRGVLIGSLKG